MKQKQLGKGKKRPNLQFIISFLIEVFYNYTFFPTTKKQH